jgi:hypothetical protein
MVGRLAATVVSLVLSGAAFHFDCDYRLIVKGIHA